MNNWPAYIPEELVNFALTLLFALLIGLEQRVHHEEESERFLFGTDRTFALIAMAGFMLYLMDREKLLPYLVGALILGAWLGLYYYFKMKTTGDFGLTSMVTALAVYALPPLIFTQRKVLVLSIFVSILILIEAKRHLKRLARKFDEEEFLTLAKFIILSGVILPLLPREELAPWLPLSLYEIWFAVIVVSGISYVSYILQKFIFPRKGLLLGALLGGFYSSTATTFILAKKSRGTRMPYRFAAAIMAATAMMYIRLWLITLIFNREVAKAILPYLALLALAGLGLALWLWRKEASRDMPAVEWVNRNPLEFKTALFFGFLFVLFSVITHYALRYWGTGGLHWLAVITGLTDIDPFILNLLQPGAYAIDLSETIRAILLATASNNVMKMVYALVLGDPSVRRPVAAAFIPLITLNAVLALTV
ncbi:MAG: MgtC/SapB family protein [Chlorobi bacterium]|nr:MgtC/SapB family protein [Chlorobiota bacterium]